VTDARAAASSDETNLRKASIRSPIDGVVLTRTVDPGNAVAASLQAVTLFTIAEDLTRMILKADIDEADVGKVREGLGATFTVSAYPNRRYPAKITRVGYGSTTKENVVTYVAELEVENGDLSLRPGMTATATITATERRGVLLVPNAALRWVPPAAEGAASGAGRSSLVGSLMPRPPGGAAVKRVRTADAAAGSQQTVHVLRQGQLVAVKVTVGATDGRQTEVSAGELKEGDAVVTDSVAASR
jgi:HlyD family secretion protein